MSQVRFLSGPRCKALVVAGHWRCGVSATAANAGHYTQFYDQLAACEVPSLGCGARSCPSPQCRSRRRPCEATTTTSRPASRTCLCSSAAATSDIVECLISQPRAERCAECPSSAARFAFVITAPTANVFPEPSSISAGLRGRLVLCSRQGRVLRHPCTLYSRTSSRQRTGVIRT